MDKAQLLKSLTPAAALLALTSEAAEAAPAGHLRDNLVAIYSFPFRIGRESRTQLDEKRGKLIRMERPKSGIHEPNNDLYLVDQGQLLNISREHLLITRDSRQFKIMDRGSACGFLVNDIAFAGRDQGGEAPINDGDVLTIGSKTSPYRFRFVVFDPT